MRIKLTLESIGKQIIDINYNYSLSSMIYSLIREANSDYSNFLHKQGYEINNKHYKLFTFSLLQPESYRVNGSDLIIDGKVALYISSPMKEFIFSLIESLTSYPEVKINKGKFRVKDIEVMTEPKFSRSMKFKCISPLTISTAFLKENSKLRKLDLYLEDKRFVDNLRSNIISKYEILHGEKPQDTTFDVNFIDIDKYRRGKLINYKSGIKIKGYLVPFEVNGNPELIAAAYACGLGDRNSLGMGMIEVIEGR